MRVRALARAVLLAVDANADGGDVIDGAHGHGVASDFGVAALGARDETVAHGVRFAAHARERLGPIRRVVADAVVGERGAEQARG